MPVHHYANTPALRRLREILNRRNQYTFRPASTGRRYFDLEDPDGRGGVIWLRYMVGGQLVEQSLKTSDKTEARKKQSAIMRPLELADTKEFLLQTEMRIKQVETEEQTEWKKANPPLKLSEVWAAYEKSQNRPRSGVRTLSGYKAHYDGFLKWLKKQHPSAVFMRDVAIREAEAYTAFLGGQKLSPSTYNQKLNTLSLIWGVLSEKGQITANPFAWDKKTRSGIQRRSLKAEAYQRKKRAVSMEEIDKVLVKAKGDYHTLILILLCTGQRLVDGVKLEWRFVDFERSLITLVPRKTSRRTGKAVFIPLLPQLRTELDRRKRIGRYVMPKLVAQYDRDTTSVSKMIKSILEDAEIVTEKETDLETHRVITDVGAHSLRHTFVTIARMAGLPDPLIRQITGHSSDAMIDHYTQFSEEMVSSLAGGLLLSAHRGEMKALPAPSAKIPASEVGRLKEARELAEQISGKKNQGLKEKLLELLQEPN